LSAEGLTIEGVTGSAARRPIDLAREPPFELRDLRVVPGLREIVAADGDRRTLEPRIMQVLVALARARGAIVSRDELVRTCWNGTIVGDDAVNRPISRLRRLAQEHGAFRIETIPRVGYRLIASSAPGEAPAAPRRQRGSKRWWIALAVPIVVAGGVVAWPASPQGPTYSISLQPFRTPPAAANFNDQLASALTGQDVPTVGGRSALTLTGSVGEDGTVNARLMTPDKAVLWSGAIRQPAAGPPDLPGAATIVGTIAQCALAGANDTGTLAPELLSLYMRTCELGARGQNALGVKVARELTRQAPDFAAGWFALSHHALTLSRSEPGDDAQLRKEAVAAAERLIALRPKAQDGYVSEALALDPRQRVERERLLRRAVELEPLYVDRAQVALSDFLLEVGRAEDAFRIDGAIARQNPQQADAQARLFYRAAATDRWLLADRALERVQALDPGSARTLLWHKAIWRGDWADAERYLPPRDPALDRVHRATYRALASGDPERKALAASEIMSLPDGCCAPMQVALLTQLDPGAAIALLERLSAGSSGVPAFDTAPFLADPALRALWRDPAIEPLLRRIGLIDYWRASGTRPDLCRAAAAPAFCGRLTLPAAPRTGSSPPS
jgi:DNA-binding winged helix-turn-helix (wHTH) protein